MKKFIVIVEESDITDRMKPVRKSVLHGVSEFPSRMGKDIMNQIIKYSKGKYRREFKMTPIELKESHYFIIEPIVNMDIIFSVGQGETLAEAKNIAEKSLMRHEGTSKVSAYNKVKMYVPKDVHIIVGVVYDMSSKEKPKKINSLYCVGKELEKMRTSLESELLGFSELPYREVVISEFEIKGRFYAVIETTDVMNHKFAVGFGCDEDDALEDSEEWLKRDMGLSNVPLCRPIQKLELR